MYSFRFEMRMCLSVGSDNVADSTGFCFKPRDWAGLRTEERAALSVAVQQRFRRLYGEQSRDKENKRPV